MNIFHLYGYEASSTYRKDSKTNVGQFALTGGGSTPTGTFNVYFGSQNPVSIYYGSSPVQSIYYGSTLVWEE